jgi:hypothetical protein
VKEISAKNVDVIIEEDPQIDINEHVKETSGQNADV